MFRFLQIKLEKKQLGSEETDFSTVEKDVRLGWVIAEGQEWSSRVRTFLPLSPQVSRAQLVQGAYLHCEVPVNQAREEPDFSQLT